jgi:hypothetical protein
MPTTSLKGSLETSQPKVLHTGEGKVLVPLTITELRDLVDGRIRLPVLYKFETALGLLDYQAVREKIIGRAKTTKP